MKHAWLASSIDVRGVWRWQLWMIGLFVVPLAGLVFYAVLQAPSRMDELVRPSETDLWVEPLGAQRFSVEYVGILSSQAPDWSSAQWQPVNLPHGVELGASIDLPADAPKARAWFRVRVPSSLLGAEAAPGALGVLGLRVMGGGPWSLWVNGQLQHANLSDWRIQWNRPLRAVLPLGTREFFIAVPHAQVQGYAMGSLLLGPVDKVDSAWMERNFWMSDAPKVAAVLAGLLVVVSLHLAISRRQEPVFALFSVNALLWMLSATQWLFDFTGEDTLSVWYGSVVDSSITWSIVFTCIFVWEYQGIAVPRLRIAMLVYAAVMTLITLPVWDWGKNALIAQHTINMLVFMLGMLVLGRHLYRSPRREGVVLLLMMLVQLPLGAHTLLYLTSQKSPDQIYTFPFAVLLLYGAFTYAISRRTLLALNAAEDHEVLLRTQLDEQERRLAQQHAALQRLEIERRLDTQRETIMQDLHDRLGSNLTSALLQARKGGLSPNETVLLLQDLADELRHIGASATQASRNLNELLAELRQRVQNRLTHGGIYLIWDVDTSLGLVLEAPAAQHVLAMLSEAIANVIKHAEATQIRLVARVSGHAVVIRIIDNGRGFDARAVASGRGLPGMRNRALAIGATLEMGAATPHGSCWTLVLPKPNS
jgi:signal transduction histidine kinase